ncbi:MAG TPA: hypothetical protein VLA71_01975, partial [Algoriphagus sp.]|nr:hypothetical protein [Algoriphagus sp.]
MNTIDLLLLLGTLALASTILIKPQSGDRIFLPLLAMVLVSAMAQIFLSGFYWQFIPAYLLLLLLAGWAFLIYPKSKKIPNKPFRFSLLVLGLATLLSCSVLIPVPSLTEPQGSFQVGTKIYRWIDFIRAEQLTADPDDKRNVVVQAWYPIDQDSKGNHSLYLDGLGNLPGKIGGVPSFLFDHFDQIDTYGKLDVPISKTKEKWPVILFLNGNGTSRSFYTSLVAGLASFGYVVLTIDHPYEAVMTQLANGELVTPIEVYLKDDPDLLKFMENRLDTRVADIQFVLTQMDSLNQSEEEFISKLDLTR